MKGRQLYTYVRETRSGTLSLYEALSGTCLRRRSGSFVFGVAGFRV